MYNEKIIKTLFKQAGIRIEIESQRENSFIVKVQSKKNIYIWENEIVNKETFYNNLIKYPKS